MTEEEKESFENVKELIQPNDSVEVEKVTIYKKAIEDFKIVLNLIQKQQKEIEELKKHDIRNIKINEKDEIKSISIPKEKLDLMNMGIALYKSFDKIFKEED